MVQKITGQIHPYCGSLHPFPAFSDFCILEKCLSSGLIDRSEILNSSDRLSNLFFCRLTSLLFRRLLTAFWRGYLEDDFFFAGGKS